ncbi:MAG TPA: hypothetical protein P5287_01605 [bacterium]|nr:hypothetical protein [bacterium]
MGVNLNDYYALIGSLPHLPRFDQATRLPITQERLSERLKMLEPGDAYILSRIESFLFWKRQVVRESEKELGRQFNSLMELPMPDELKEFIRTVMTQRVVMVQLRRRQRGLPPPVPGAAWGFGHLLRHIEKYWAEPDFKLAYPFIPRARELLAAGDAPELDKHGGLYGMRLVDTLVFEKEYTFIGVVGYVFRWNMVAYWLSFDREMAQKRFEELVAEVCSEFEKRSEQ